MVRTDTNSKLLTIALVGNPNSGKSTLFNELTGLNQKIGNYPGITVEKKSGICFLQSDNKVIKTRIVDLPGIYSLYPSSEDEKIAAQILTDENHIDHPDIVVFVADASNIRRSLMLCTQILDIGLPVLLNLNMIDITKKRGEFIDPLKLGELLGTEVVMTNARKREGVSELKNKLAAFNISEHKHQFAYVMKSASNILERYQKIDALLKSSLTKKAQKSGGISLDIDRILTHRLWGYMVFLGILFMVFQAVFSWAQFPMMLIDTGFTMFGEYLNAIFPAGPILDMIVHGVLAGLSGVLIFIPQIAILFFFIAILENTGYMARVSFIMDRIMRKFGLSGRSVVPLISGVACAVPAIMSTRNIPGRKERLITILATPFITCSARIPVYILIISLIIPDKTVFGIFNLQGVTLLGMYSIGFIAAILISFLLKYLIKSQERNLYITEMPDYRWPRWKDVFIVIYSRLKIFVLKVGQIIISISIVLWFLASNAPGDSFSKIDDKYAKMQDSNIYNNDELENLKASDKLEASYMGHFGKTIEPVILPIGFNWKIGIGLLSSFAAREVFVGTMATLYSIQDKGTLSTLKDKMKSEVFPGTNEKVYSAATGFSLLIFYAFAMQCMSTLAVAFEETGHWKWPALIIVYMTLLAYLTSWLVYTFLS